MGTVVAKYIRLSMEDALSESDSIENQHWLLDRYISTLPQENIRVLEFVDNGYTGTNLERPQFQKMLSLVQAGEIDCIVVKDFSRLGRNVVDSGYFVEKVFPLYRVRFVALCDRYDSGQNQDNAAAMEMTFKFLVNEMYSKDLSKKIRAAKADRTQRGLYVTKNCVYGYRLDKNRKMVVDPKAAGTVRLVFNLALQGEKPDAIARRLYMENRLAPGAYKGHRKQGSSFDCIWSKNVIFSMLRNEQYTGTYVAGKTCVTAVGSKQTILKDESKWVKIPGHHPAIVGKADFDAVQEILGERRKKKRGKQKSGPDKQGSPLKGKVFCGHCGHHLRRAGRDNLTYKCDYTRHAPDAACHGLSIPEKELARRVTANVLQCLQKRIADGSFSSSVPKDRAASAGAETAQQLYERFLAGEIDRDAYLVLQAKREEEARRAKLLPQAPEVLVLPGVKAQKTPAQHHEIARAALDAGALTTDAADAFIDKVLVQPNGSIEICWKPNTEHSREDLEDIEDAG